MFRHGAPDSYNERQRPDWEKNVHDAQDPQRNDTQTQEMG